MKKQKEKNPQPIQAASDSLPEEILTLRFDVENGEEPVTVKAPLKKLSRANRIMLADRLYGIDVFQLWKSDTTTQKMHDQLRLPIRIKASEPTLGSLLEAVRNDQLWAEDRLQRHRAAALAVSLANGDAVAIIEEYNKALQAGRTSSAR